MGGREGRGETEREEGREEEWIFIVKAFPKSTVGFPGGASGKEPTCQCRRCKRCEFDSWVRKIWGRQKWKPTLVFLTGKSHRQRSLGGYSPWGGKESYATECAHTLLASETPRGPFTSSSHPCLLQKTLAGRNAFLWKSLLHITHVSQYLFLLINRHRFERPPCSRHFFPLTFLFSAILSSVLLFLI